jgi:hypothetical protein
MKQFQLLDAPKSQEARIGRILPSPLAFHLGHTREASQIIADKERKNRSNKRREKCDEQSTENAHEDLRLACLKVDRISPLDFAVKPQQNFKAPKGQSDPWSGSLDMGFCGSVLPPLKLSLAGCTTPCGPSRASSFKSPELFVVA